MFSLFQAINYRCLKRIEQHLDPFLIMVGPNASGKTTFLDALVFLGDLVNDGLDAAIEKRTTNFQDLTWQRRQSHFELAVEARIPDEIRRTLPDNGFGVIRYEVVIHKSEKPGENLIENEKVTLTKETEYSLGPRELFPQSRTEPETVLSKRGRSGDIRTIISKVPDGNDNFYAETKKSAKIWSPSFKLGPRKSALGNLPEDETNFPCSTWLKSLLSEDVRHLILNSLLMRKASPPSHARGFKTDGSNLPWVIDRLLREHPEKFGDWIEHLKTALPDIETIRTVLREDDKHRYLMVSYRGGVEVPSWLVSDGTLRLLALTLLAYLPEFRGVYLLEEPENGIHPQAVETVFQSLSSVYEAQILLATHSPVILGIAEPHQVLCFKKTEEGETDIVLGSNHPQLRHWKGEITLGDLFAAGVLG